MKYCVEGTTSSAGSDDISDCTASTCVAGKYCTPGSAALDCPIGTFNTAAGGKFVWDACTFCSAGYACKQVSQSSSTTTPCDAGYFCPVSTEFARQFPCPAGTYSDLTYLTTASSCTTCTAGSFCVAGSTSTIMQTCPRGAYCTPGNKYSHQDLCPAGTYLWTLGNDASTDCVACPVGRYCQRGANWISGYCAQGYFCPASSTFPDDNDNKCGAGTYNPLFNSSSITECLTTPGGYFSWAAMALPIACPEGTFKTTGGTQPSDCGACTAGKYCPKGTATPIDCAAGYYSSAGAAACSICPAGTYCTGGTSNTALGNCPAGKWCPIGTSQNPTSLTAYNCPIGFYCVAGATTPVECPAGKYGASSGLAASSACTDSAAGKYTIMAAFADTGLCDPGFYCVATSNGPWATPCAAGTFRSTPGATASSDCSACTAGYYCPLGSIYPTVCPVGYYCLASVATPTYCPIGTIGLTSGLSTLAGCSSCPEGSYCSTPGLLVPDGFCTQGYLCSAGSSSSTPSGTICTAGGYCEPGFPTKRNCPPGSFNSLTGAKDVSWCKPCTAGYFCLGSESTITANTCLAGYYCPIGSYWGKQQIAGPGTYTTAGQSTTSQCQPPKYNPVYAQSSCIDCPAGFYCNAQGMSSPVVCPIGSYCIADVNYFTSCAVGTFNPRLAVTSQANCLYCTPGYNCPTAGLSSTPASLLCDPGYYCTFGAVSKKPGDYVVANAASGVYGLCPAGNYCPQGSPVPIPCPSGTYRFNQLGAALTDCAECTEGYYCTDIALTTTQGECDAGYYCFAEQRWPRPPIGSLPTTLQYCVAGEFCVAGSNEPVDCPAGTYQDLDYQSTCITCPEGYFCPDKTGDYSVNICPLGHYCPEGTQFSNQYPCPSGTYSPAQGLIEDTQCLQCTPGNYCQNLGQSAVSGLCDAGYFCKIGSKSINPQISYPGDSNGGKCLPGYYCPQGSAMALECDGGSYCATTALAAPTGLCNAGYYCIGKATIANPTDGTTGNICPAGFYCPSGSISPIACPKGTYLGSTGNDQLSDCVDCPAGQYCGNSALTTPTGSCAAGYFCPGSNYEYRPLASKCIVGYYCPTGSPDKIVCPTGYYQDQTLQSSCKVCPQGYYCPNSAMTAPTRCDPGYYCPQGTINKLECGAGTYNALFGRWLITQCLACPPGKYCDGTANSTPDGDCLSGYYCTGGAIQSDPDNDAQGGKCPKGNFCPTGSVAPTKCTPGSYCQIAALTAVTGQCSAGFYCLEGASSPTPRDRVTGAVCPTGYYCPIGSQMPTPCDPGYYQSAQGKSAVSDCIICPAGFYCADRASPSISGICSAGYYCPVGQITPTPVAYICDIAFFCPANSGTQNPCVLGTYQNQIGQSSCKTCPAGFYCDMNESTPHLCPIGYMCPAGSSSTSKIACGDGQYQPFQGQSSCLTCPMGYKCGTGPVTVPTICPIYSYCVEGTNDPAPFCPSGKYTDKTGLQSKDECMPCPVGKYCTNGRVQADCEPGYYCISGVNTPTPDSYTNSGYGQPCPEGYYCEIGTTLPTPCPSGKFRTATTGKTASDCSDCQAGYYCIMNDPVPKVCPSGHYCPAGSDTPIPCPAGHYALYKQSVSSDVCTICPEGYLCSQMGTADYKNYPCTPGYYCSEGTLILTESPEGYYSPGYNAGSEEDLKECPPGYYCEEKSTGYEFCLTGTYCPKGTSTPQNCTAGNFCEYVSASPTKCPTGWYCPLYSSDLTELPPLNCPERTLCPAGTKTPGSCSAGYIVTTATTVINPVIPSCDSCPPGKYSTDQTSKCFDCNAGYMCLGKTPTPTPVELDTGYQCDRGYYCPVGALKQYRCPEGTYSNETTLTSLSACINCPINQYNDMPAQTECKKCGIYATSAEGATGCSCRASNRVYLQNSGHCICQNGYEFIDSSGNDRSSEDGLGECSQKVYTRCNLGEVRDELGSCRSTTDCNSECNGGKGTRSPSSGLCQCEEVDDVNQACNLNCRTESQTMTFNELGQFEIYDPTTGLKEKIDKSDIQGIKGSPACYPNKSCKVHSVEMTADVGIKGLFGVTSAVKSSNARRIQDDTSKYIKNPVICLNIGETMAFSVIAPNHYPVYMKDSLLNSNPNFDYSEFDDLKTEMQTNSNTTLFVFSFNQGGVYLFADAADKSQQLVVGVMSDSSECPYTDSQIQPRTASAIHLIGTNLKTDIILDVNWEVVIGLMISLVVAVLIFTALFYYYSKLAWKMSPSERVPYRELNKHLHIEGDEGTRTTMQLVIDGKEPGSSSSDAEEVREMIFEKVPEVAAYEPTTYLDENNQVDSGLVQAIKEKIRNNNKQVMKFLEDSAADSQQRMQKLAEETEELRNLLYDLLDPLNQLVGKPSKKLLKDISGHEDSIMGSVQPTLIPDLDYQEALDEIAENSGLIDQDKNKLMNELNSELQKLEDNIKSDKSKQDEELQRRLALRAKRRKELEKEKHEIEKQEKALTKTHLNELWEANMKLEEEEKQIQVDFNSEKEEIRRNVLGEQVVDLQQKLQASIKAHPDRSQEFLRQYEQHVEALENNLTMNQMRQHQELVKRLEEKRTQRKAALRDRQAQVESEIRSKQQAEKQDLERKKHDLEIEEAVAEALPITTVEVSDKSLKNLEKRHKDELQNYEKELKSLENKEVSSLQKQATIKESKLTQQKADLERQKKKLVEMVSNASEDERESLLRDLADTEMRLKDTADKASQEQKKNLDERLELRRKMRDEKLKALKQKQDEEKRNLEAQAKVKLTEDKAQQLDQAIQTALAKLPADKQNEAIKALLEEKHEHERDKLQRKLRKKLRDRQKDTIREIMRMKASDLEVLRNEFKDKIKAAGRDSEALAQIQHDESEALNRIDYHYMKQLEKAQEDAWRDQQQKNQKELLALIDQQLAEMRKHLRQQGADSSGNKELEEDLKKERQRVEEEGKRKLYDLSKKKEELEALRQQKQKELEDMLLKEKQREEMENRRQLLLDKKRALMEKQKKIREDLLKRGQLTNEQMEKLISEHQRELSALENAIARERDRQMALMTQKLAEKMQKKNEYEFTVQKMKEEQSRWQKEMEELPGITNKQATTLLLKWRRYPKRGIKDIEKAIKTVDPMERSFPVPVALEDVTTTDGSDPRLEELVSRVDRIEKIVKNVDTSQFGNAVKALEELEKAMKNLKA